MAIALTQGMRSNLIALQGVDKLMQTTQNRLATGKRVNSALDDTPETINSDPFGAGWMIEIKLSDAGELDGLLDATAYAKHCAEREG